MLARAEALESSYTEGDNSLVVATDSMKNFIHREAIEFAGEYLEDFLVQLGEHFLARYEHIEGLELKARETIFARRVGRVLQRLYDDHAVVEMWLYDDGSRLEGSDVAKGLAFRFTGRGELVVVDVLFPYAQCGQGHDCRIHHRRRRIHADSA